MKFYYFGGDIPVLDKIYDSQFDGTLFLYNAAAKEYFTLIALNASNIKKDFKYMVAIRPYVISPQYLSMIHRSIYNSLGNILQINLITGWIKDEEIPYNSFVGKINDKSGHVERSEYLIDYLKALNTLKNNLLSHQEHSLPDVYVSTTNRFVFDAASRYNNKIILPYRLYKNGSFPSDPSKDPDYFDLKDKTIIISLSLIVRDTEEELKSVELPPGDHDFIAGTPSEIINKLKELKNSHIEGVLIFAWEPEQDRLFKFLKQYKHLI